MREEEAQTRRWLAEFVIGLNLCPFARPLLESANLRIAVFDSTDMLSVQRAFLDELDLLQSVPESEIATTVIVFPTALASFEDYLDFLEEARALLEHAGLAGIVQLASFHPLYRFAGEPDDAASHYSNRSPYPSIHLIREAMITRVLEEFPDPQAIPERNIVTLDAIGTAELERRWQRLFESGA
jgi:hypothetical protein